MEMAGMQQPGFAALRRRGRRDAIRMRPSRLHVAIAIVYVAGYVVLDWASYVEPFGSFGITPWNPHTGLSVSLILLLGRGYLPLLVVAPLVADAVVRSMPAPWSIEVLLALAVGSGYGAAAYSLMRSQSSFDITLPSARDVFLLVSVATTSAAAVAVCYVTILAGGGLIAWADFWQAAVRLWIGDVIGIVVVTPFLLIIARSDHVSRPDGETIFQVLAILACLWLIRGSTAALELHIFYLLFLPVVWIALRHGLEGAVAGLVLAQLGLMLAIGVLARSDVDITTYQAMMLVLALTGLTVGIAVSERRRAEIQLRQQQEAQSRIARLGSISELSAALAHEISQPLSAAATYSRLAIEMLEAENASAQTALDPLVKCSRQVQRAADVVRRLREFIQLGRSELAPVKVAQLFDEAMDLVRPELVHNKVDLRRDRAGELDLPIVSADRLQIEQVLINVITNAIEAMQGANRGHPIIRISGNCVRSGFVEIRIEDNGPGFDAAVLARPFEPFGTTKSQGLGVGLSLCRSIVEAHGGELWLDNSDVGAVVHFTLREAG